MFVQTMSKHEDSKTAMRSDHGILECMEVLSIAAQNRINVYAVKSNWRLARREHSQQEQMAFWMAAEFERDLIS